MKRYAMAVNAGNVQLQTVDYRANGTSIVKPVSDWLPVQDVKLGMAGFQIRMMRAATDNATRQSAERQLLKLFQVKH